MSSSVPSGGLAGLTNQSNDSKISPEIHVPTNMSNDTTNGDSHQTSVSEIKENKEEQKLDEPTQNIEIIQNNQNEIKEILIPENKIDVVASGNDNSTATNNIQTVNHESMELERKSINEDKEINEINGKTELGSKPVLNEDNTVNQPAEEMKQIETKENNDNDGDENEILDVQTLTEQIMNILNNGNDLLSSPQDLLKKNVELQEFILKLIQVLKEKTNLCTNLELQNNALIGQAKSLKDVISITKDLLGIRNMEVEHLHEDMTSMENRIKEERVRHNTAVGRLNEALQLNEKLKTEYLIQMGLFQKLRDKYNEKVVYLTKENQRLNEILKNANLIEENGNDMIQEVIPEDKGIPIAVGDLQDENVEK